MSTYSFTGTDTYTVADIKVVMQNTYEDIIGFANAEFIEYSDAEKWIEDLTYLLKENLLIFFEIQLYDSSGIWFKSYKYSVDTNGYLTTGRESGGILHMAIPKGTRIGLFANFDRDQKNSQKVLDELVTNRGWGTSGSSKTGTEVVERNYTSNSLNLKRSVITK